MRVHKNEASVQYSNQFNPVQIYVPYSLKSVLILFYNLHLILCHFPSRFFDQNGNKILHSHHSQCYISSLFQFFLFHSLSLKVNARKSVHYQRTSIRDSLNRSFMQFIDMFLPRRKYKISPLSSTDF